MVYEPFGIIGNFEIEHTLRKVIQSQWRELVSLLSVNAKWTKSFDFVLVNLDHLRPYTVKIERYKIVHE